MTYSKKRPETGQGLVEYALILVLVAVVTIVTLALVGQNVADVFYCVVHELGAQTRMENNGVYRYTLINTATNEEMGRPPCGESIDFNTVNFRGDAASDVSEVTFDVVFPNGSIVSRTEASAPWAVFGDSGGVYLPPPGGSLPSGRYEVIAKTNKGQVSHFVFNIE